MLEGFHDEDPGRPGLAGDLRREHPDWSGADHQHVGSRPKVTQPHRVNRDTERFEQSAAVIADLVGEREQQVVGPQQLFLHGAVQRAVPRELNRGQRF